MHPHWLMWEGHKKVEIYFQIETYMQRNDRRDRGVRCLPHHQFCPQCFTDRVIPVWNSLPQDVVSSLNITVFHSRLLFIGSL